MSDLLFPTVLNPSSSSLQLLDTAGRFVSPLTGYTRTVSRAGGERLRLSLQFHGLKDERRAAMQSFIAAMRGGVNRVWCHDHSYTKRGSFPATELIPNVAFDDTTGWTLSSQLSHYAAEGKYRLTRTAVSANTYSATAAISVVSSGYHVIRLMLETGRGREACNVLVSSAPGGGSAYFSGGATYAPGLIVGKGTISGTVYVSILDYYQDTSSSPIATRVIDDFQIFSGISLSRCPIVNGANQTGSSLSVTSLPTSTNGLLLPGDQFQIGNELKIVTASLNSNSSGVGTLIFEPPLRESPATNDPVIVHKPMGKFMLQETENGWNSMPGVYSDADLTLVEAS